MGNLRGITGTSRARYALVVAALALFGLLSMHGWGTHAGMHANTSHPSAHAAMLHDDEHAALIANSHPGQVAGPAAAMNADAASCDNDCGGSGSGGMGLVGLCLAILGGFVLLGLALLLRRRWFLMSRTLLPPLRHPILVSRDRDPPDLLRLCVIRC